MQDTHQAQLESVLLYSYCEEAQRIKKHTNQEIKRKVEQIFFDDDMSQMKTKILGYYLCEGSDDEKMHVS